MSSLLYNSILYRFVSHAFFCPFFFCYSMYCDVSVLCITKIVPNFTLLARFVKYLWHWSGGQGRGTGIEVEFIIIELVSISNKPFASKVSQIFYFIIIIITVRLYCTVITFVETSGEHKVYSLSPKSSDLLSTSP